MKEIKSNWNESLIEYDSNDYYKRFKDNDSYNDYIIKLDTIFKDNSLIEKNNEDNDENENEILNSQIKDKDESFTNY